MQAVINVKGTKMSVLSTHRSETGKLLSVYANNEDGHEIRYIDKELIQYDESAHVAIENLEGALEYPEFEARIAEERNKLIHHLEAMQREENNKLNDILTEMGETKVEYPFEKLGEKLVVKQEEYKLAQQRVFGIIDTIEEAKAHFEGWYADADDGATETQSSHSTTD